jgi:hypothetical protein
MRTKSGRRAGAVRMGTPVLFNGGWSVMGITSSDHPKSTSSHPWFTSSVKSLWDGRWRDQVAGETVRDD